MTYARLSLDGALVVLTGASGGIGEATSDLLVSRGASVLAVDLALPPGGSGRPGVRAVAADVATVEGWEAVRQQVDESSLPVRALVNNAGVLAHHRIGRVQRPDWDRVMDVNLKGTWLGMKTLGPLIGDQGGGAIVNVSSAAGLDHHPGVAYTASKWGVRGLTKTGAQELGPRGVRVNSIHPGYIDTLMGNAAPSIARTAMLSLLPIARPGDPVEVAELIAYLVSDASAYVTGAEIAIDGGWTSGAQATEARRA